MKKLIACLFVCMTLSACGKQMPEPQSVQAATNEHHSLLTVNHFVRNSDILIECHIPTINLNEKQSGKIQVSINGKLYKQFDTAAFIVKNVSPGTHELVVEVVKPNNQPTGLKSAFSVTIK
ncbi:hypothetical protein [Bacillus sp. FJAT-50079]|uniref:hypothetical protein n=1 Tax=Bacillus sp. FJAT-50079 TaxID=2833577 RepID=UPI001BCA5727|nr:hypothetical protein [Bacillus sp. FJAT-50079]MBS4207743.1 hypothetical protein [Bacillus sp. FJAT-50079]